MTECVLVVDASENLLKISVNILIDWLIDWSNDLTDWLQRRSHCVYSPYTVTGPRGICVEHVPLIRAVRVYYLRSRLIADQWRHWRACPLISSRLVFYIPLPPCPRVQELLLLAAELKRVMHQMTIFALFCIHSLSVCSSVSLSVGVLCVRTS